MNKSVGAGWVVCWWYQLSSSFWGIVDVGLEGKKNYQRERRRENTKAKTHTHTHTKQMQYKQIQTKWHAHSCKELNYRINFVNSNISRHGWLQNLAIFFFFSICPQKLKSKNNLCQLHFLFKSVSSQLFCWEICCL